MHLPSISTLKSYINESEQCSGWQNKIAYQLLANLTTNKIWEYGKVGFFSHDFFKIQKGYLFIFLIIMSNTNTCKNSNFIINYLKIYRSSLEST